MKNLNEKTIAKYLTNYEGAMYIFTFPWLPTKKELVVEIGGLVKYWRNQPEGKRIDFDRIREELACEAALIEYNRRDKETKTTSK